MKNQKSCMPVGDYFIPTIELKPMEDKILNKYSRMCRTFRQEQKTILFDALAWVRHMKVLKAIAEEVGIREVIIYT